MAFLDKNKLWLLFLTSIVTGLVFLDSTVLPVALPTIEKDLTLSSTTSMWVVNIYLLSMVVLFLIGGRFSDLFGKKRAYLLGLALFGVGSVMAAMSFHHSLLLIGRAIQGCGGALVSPTTGALLIDAFPIKERARAIGLNTGISSFFLLIGPLVGGFLTAYLGWRYIFWINIPIIVLAIMGSLKILPANERAPGKFHFMGAIPLALSLFFLVFALMQATAWGWLSAPILLSFALSPLFFFLFIQASRKAEHPIFDFVILKSASFRGASLAIFIVQFIIMVTVFFQLFWQLEREIDVLDAGFLMMAATSPVLLAAPLGGFLSDRFNPRLPTSLGFGLIAVGLTWIFLFSMASIEKNLFGLVLLGAGIPMIFSPSFAFAMTTVAKTHLASASSMITTIRQVAGTLGLAVMSALFYSSYGASHSYLEAFSSLLLMGTALAVVGFVLTFIFLRLPPSER